MNEHKARCKRKQGNDLQLPCFCSYCKVNLGPHIAYIPQPLFRVYATKHACSIFIKIKSIIKFLLHARTDQASKRRQQLRSQSGHSTSSRSQSWPPALGPHRRNAAQHTCWEFVCYDSRKTENGILCSIPRAHVMDPRRGWGQLDCSVASGAAVRSACLFKLLLKVIRFSARYVVVFCF